MDSVALTDHGNMYGMVDFYKKAKDAGVKPIFGCETYVSATTMEDKTERKNYHLILLAKNMEGYKNLQYLNSMAFLEGFYYHPRIDKKLLKDHSKGLIGLSACLGGEVAQTLMREGYEKAKEKALEYKSLFEDDSFYLEVQPNGLDEQEQVNDSLEEDGAARPGSASSPPATATTSSATTGRRTTSSCAFSRARR